MKLKPTTAAPPLTLLSNGNGDATAHMDTSAVRMIDAKRMTKLWMRWVKIGITPKMKF